MSIPNRKITPSQLFSALFLSRLFASMTYISGLDRELHPGETVVAMIFSSVFIILAGVCGAFFFESGQNEGILIRAERISNKFFIISALFYIVFFIAFCSLVAARFNLFVNSIVFPDSDMSWFVLPVIAGCAFIARNGIESVARSSVLFTFIIVISLVFVFVTASTEFDVLNFNGVRPGKWGEMSLTGFLSASRTAELASVPIVTGFLSKKPTKSLLGWVGIISLSLICISVMVTGVLGRFGYEQIFPMYSLTVLAEFGILERLDAIITAVWVLCFIAKMSYFLFVNSYILNSLLPKKTDLAPFICAVPVGIGAMAMSKSVDVLARIIRSGFQASLFIFGAVLLPLCVVAAEKIRKNKTTREQSV